MREGSSSKLGTLLVIFKGDLLTNFLNFEAVWGRIVVIPADPGSFLIKKKKKNAKKHFAVVSFVLKPVKLVSTPLHF